MEYRIGVRRLKPISHLEWALPPWPSAPEQGHSTAVRHVWQHFSPHATPESEGRGMWRKALSSMAYCSWVSLFRGTRPRGATPIEGGIWASVFWLLSLLPGVGNKPWTEKQQNSKKKICQDYNIMTTDLPKQNHVFLQYVHKEVYFLWQNFTGFVCWPSNRIQLGTLNENKISFVRAGKMDWFFVGMHVSLLSYSP